MQKFLNIIYENGTLPNINTYDDNSNFKSRSTPFSQSDVYKCPIYNFNVLTNENLRKVYELKISSTNVSNDFEPGCTIGLLPSNDEKIVNELMIRLGIEAVCDHSFKLSILNNTTKKNASIPKHIPQYGTLRNVFLYHVDIRSIPKKLFLKALLEFVSDQQEYEELEFLCSPKGSEEYNNLISSYSQRTLAGLLQKFPSCHPPIERLLEYLPPLLPRPYSISSSPLNKEYLSITFNVDTFNDNEKGVCTGWLERCIEKFKETKYSEIPIYFRTPSTFKLPNDNTIPIIMIGTGTGIAPFRGFLEHRHLQITSQNISLGESWLFYGCRDSDKNYLYKDDIQVYLKSGALSKLYESFSRASEQKSYVQHNIEKYGEELSSMIVDKGAVVYVCGDFSKVLPAVRNAVLKVIMEFRSLSREEAELYLRNLEKDHKYIVENWN